MNRHVDETITLDELSIAAGAVEDTGVVVIDEKGDSRELPKHAALQRDGTVRLPLLFPVTLRFKSVGSDAVREEAYSEFKMRRLTGADMRAITSVGNDEGIVVAIGKSAGIPGNKMGPLFDRMDAADTKAASDVVSYFFGSGQKTGR